MVVPILKKVKTSLKIVGYIFISYAYNRSAYRFLKHEPKISDIHKDMIMELRNALFFTHVFSCKSKEGSSLSKRTFETINENS